MNNQCVEPIIKLLIIPVNMERCPKLGCYTSAFHGFSTSNPITYSHHDHKPAMAYSCPKTSLDIG